MELTGFLIIVAGVVLEVLGQVAFKRGAQRVMHLSGEQPVLLYWRDLARTPWIQLGIVSQIVALLFWIAALNFVPLSVAFPFASLSYCGVAAYGHYWLGERLSGRSIAAVVMIMTGAALVGWPPR